MQDDKNIAEIKIEDQRIIEQAHVPEKYAGLDDELA